MHVSMSPFYRDFPEVYSQRVQVEISEEASVTKHRDVMQLLLEHGTEDVLGQM